MTAQTAYVVDAGVGLKLVLPEALADRAAELFDLLATDPPAAILHVPDLFYIECANALWKHVRRGNLSACDAAQAAAILLALDLSAVRTADLMQSALDAALRDGITAYDACYVALSDGLSIPLVSADEALVRKLTGSGHNVQSLAALLLPSRQAT